MPSLVEIKSELLRLKWDIAASRSQFALRRHAQALEKSGFDPNQPRVPAGRSNGGQWTSGGASGGGVSIRFPLALGDEAGLGILDEEGAFEDFYGYWDFVDFGELGFLGDLDLTDFSGEGQGPGIGHNQGPPIEDPSDIPEEKPETIKRGNRIARQVSRDPVLSTYYLLTIVAMGHRHWLNDMSWEIMADQDPPKTLDELYDAMSSQTNGVMNATILLNKRPPVMKDIQKVESTAWIIWYLFQDIGMRKSTHGIKRQTRTLME